MANRAYSRPISEEDLQLYVDGRLPDGRVVEVECYLAESPEALRRVESYRSQNITLHALYDSQVLDPLSGDMAALTAKLEGAMKHQERMRRVMIAGALALAALAGAGLTLLLAA